MIDRYEWLMPTGGNVIVFFNTETQKIENIVMNLIEDHEYQFIHWLSKKTGLLPFVVNECYFEYKSRLSENDFPQVFSDTRGVPKFTNDYIIKVCVEWADIEITYYREPMVKFLASRFGTTDGVLNRSVSSFGRDLKKAEALGLIIKGPNKRWLIKDP
jgi:hypothetical protein